MKGKSVDPTEELLADQVRYYRARAAEFDRTAYGIQRDRNGQPFPVSDDVRLIGDLGITGDVLELACGTGNWTQHLAHTARSVVAVDVAAEMIELAQPKIRTSNVTFKVADVFNWSPDRRFDTIFFGFLLSHVPPPMFDDFWRHLEPMLRPGGRVVAIDELPDRRDLEPHLQLEDGLPVARRTLSDGSDHRLVKVFYDAEELRTSLAALGWDAEVKPLPRGLFLLQAQRQG
jgi:2-polyprenyl-3-methyl-5-hydroxy-6-metoxy-1,4-benzoquinol methylase